MQSTGQTSTQAVSFVPMHGSVITKGMSVELTQKNPGSEPSNVQGGLTEAEKRANVVRLAFGGSEEQFQQFIRIISEEIPGGTGVILRGSAVTGVRWRDGAPFDADGPGTSDLDLTL